MTTMQELWDRYLNERATYDAVAKAVGEHLRGLMREWGVICEVQARAKDVDQFVKKILRKEYSKYEEVGDKAGARVVVRYYSELERAEEAIRSRFEVTAYEDKRVALGYDRLGYLGIHFQVRVTNELVGVLTEPVECEIQLQTAAERVWADASHDLLYKQEYNPPESLQRSLYRLVALTELFDEQLVAGRDALMATPEFRVAAVLAELEQIYYDITARSFDKELSKTVVAGLLDAYEEEDASAVAERLHAFAEQNGAKLREKYNEYADDPRANPLLFQPEVVSVFERLEMNPFVLKEVWARLLPVELLENLGVIWGVRVS